MYKKNKNIKAILAVFCLVFFVGCDDYLSELPDNRTNINSPDKVTSLITGAYSEGNYQLMAEIMSDNADQKVENTSNRYQEGLYSWDEVNDFEDRDTPTFFWNNTYEAISQANQALASIEELKGSFDLSAQKGEALLARAFNHFMLVSFWSKRYDPASAESDMGIPYVLEPETVLIKKYKRNSIKEVYDLIEKDLLEGLSLVKNNYNEPKFHFTKEAGAAFAARFYLYKGDWDKVIKYANIAVTNPDAQLRDMNAYRSLSYDQNRLLYPSIDESSNLLIISTSSLWARGFAGSSFGMSATKASEFFFGGSGNPLGKAWAYAVYGNDQVYNLPKFREYFRFTNQSAGIGQPFLGIVAFDRDEALLNRAEAYAMKNNFSEALSDLDVFLSKKTSGYNASTDKLSVADITTNYPVVENEFTPSYTLTDEQASFVKVIAELKRREFYHEGLRWFDIKRFDLVVSHRVSSVGEPLVLPKGDNKRVLQIPRTAIKFGVTENPRD